MKTHRRTVAALAARGVGAARELYTTVPCDTIRVAALVEISAAAAHWRGPWSSCATSTPT